MSIRNEQKIVLCWSNLWLNLLSSAIADYSDLTCIFSNKFAENAEQEILN